MRDSESSASAWRGPAVQRQFTGGQKGERSMSKIFAISTAMALALAIGLASTPSSARVGQKCGGFAGPVCSANEFCQLPTGVCFTPDIQGRCARVPARCPMMIVNPVCGCNGQTYANDCLREMAKVSKRHNGRC
jgi:hypothetical protein